MIGSTFEEQTPTAQLDTDLFIQTHVVGVIQPVNLASMPQIAAREIEEHYDAEAMRRASYIEFLCSKKTVLTNRLHGTKYKNEFVDRWGRFTDDKFSNIRRSDHPYNSGDSNSLVRYSRSYRPPAHGKPGRLRCVNSLQDIFRPVRNRLIELVCEDFDQRCAAGTGGLYIARHIGARHNCLLALVTDPTAWKASMQDAGYPKRAVRDLLNTIWTCDPRCEKMHAIARKHGKKFVDFLHLFNEVQLLKIEAFRNPDLQWALPFIKDGDNRIGRFFSTILTAIEAVCTNSVVDFAVRHFNWKIMAIVHDGFNPIVKLNKERQAFFCRVFGAVCEAIFPGIHLTWCVKPFDFMMYDKNGVELREFTIPQDWQPPENSVDDPEEVEEDEEYEGDPEGRSDFFPSYELVKMEHENEFFKVEAVFVDLLTHAGDGNQGLTVRAKAWMLDKFQNKMHSKVVPKRDDRRELKRDKYGKVVTERVNVEFLSRWLKDPHMKSFTSFRMQPGEPEEIVVGKTRHYNMWTPYYVETIDPSRVDMKNGRRICIKYIHFVHMLLGGEEVQTLFALDFQAHPFVHPHLKPKVMACLLGAQGAGKTTMPKVSEYIMGQSHCCTTTLPERLVENGNWASASKKMAVINEVPPDRVKKAMDDLKPLITDSPLECKSMGKDPTWLPSVISLWLTSNYLTALQHAASEKERRYWFAYCTSYWEEYANSLPPEETNAFWTKLHDELASDDFLYVLWEFYKRRSYRVPGQWQKNGVPESDLGRVSKNACKEWLHELLEKMCMEWELEVPVPANSVSYEAKVCIDASPKDQQTTLRNEYERLRTSTKVIHKDGIVHFSNAFLQARLDEFVQDKGWQERKGMNALGDKLGFFAIAHKGACRQMEGVPSRCKEGKVRYGRGWEFNLDMVRRVLKLDVGAARRMRILSRHKNWACTCMENAEFELKRFECDNKATLQNSAHRKAQRKVDEIREWLAFMDGRIALLNQPVKGAKSAFDAEQHFEEVWNHEAQQRDDQLVPTGDVSPAPSESDAEPAEADVSMVEALDGTGLAEIVSSSTPITLEAASSSVPPAMYTGTLKRASDSFTTDGQLTADRQGKLMEQASKARRQR